MLTHWRRERFIRKTLRQLARQRVFQILQPGNVPVVENAVMMDRAGVPAALLTCHFRGWTEVVQGAVPHGTLTPSGDLPPGFSGVAPVYRLTEAGWAEIQATHFLLVVTFLVALAGTVAAVLALAR